MKNNKITILYLTGDSSLTGAPRHIALAADHLDAKKFRVAVVAPTGPLQKLLPQRIPYRAVPMRRALDWTAIKKVRQIIKQSILTGSTIVHAHGMRGGAIGRLAAFGLNAPVVYTEHQWTEELRLGRVRTWMQLSALWLLDMLTTVTVAPSRAVGAFLLDANITRKQKLALIPNGIVLPKPRRQTQQKDHVTIGTVGSLLPVKGQQYLLAAFKIVLKELPQARLVIVGDGPQKENLARIARYLQIDNKVVWKRQLRGAALAREMAGWTLYAQPSLSETFGQAALQALALGVPVVASAVGGLIDVVDEAGALVPPADDVALAAAMLHLLQHPESQKKYRRLGPQQAKKFTLEKTVQSLEKLYLDLLPRQHPK